MKLTLPFRATREWMICLGVIASAYGPVMAQAPIAEPKAQLATAPQAVHIVCLAESVEALATPSIWLKVLASSDLEKELLNALNLIFRERDLDKALTAIKKLKQKVQIELKKVVADVDGKYYLPLGSGVVLDKAGTLVLTNYHVANACRIDSSTDRDSRRQLAILEPVSGGFRAIRAEEDFEPRKKTDNIGNPKLDAAGKPELDTIAPKPICRTRTEDCFDGAIKNAGKLSDEQYAAKVKHLDDNQKQLLSLSNVLHWAPDLALLRLTDATKIPAVEFDFNSILKAGDVLAFSGFPGVAETGRESTDGPSSRDLKVKPVTLSATFSQPVSIDNSTNVVGIPQNRVVKTDLYELSGANALPGNSGGPLYDPASGKVLGLISKGLYRSDAPIGMSYAVAATEIKKFLQIAAPKLLTVETIKPPLLPTSSPRPVVTDGAGPSVVEKYRIQILGALIAAIGLIIGAFVYFQKKRPNPNPVPVPTPTPTPTPTKYRYMITLRCTQGKLSGKDFYLPDAQERTTITVGRSPAECQIVFLDVEEISDRHCKFIVNPTAQTLHVEDLRSTNGTFVNKRKLNPGEKVKLSEADAVSLARPDGNVFIVKLP